MVHVRYGSLAATGNFLIQDLIIADLTSIHRKRVGLLTPVQKKDRPSSFLLHLTIVTILLKLSC